jgi:hypothetical protein
LGGRKFVLDLRAISRTVLDLSDRKLLAIRKIRDLRAARQGKTVWRGGYQISYDSLPTQLIFLGPATTTPNAINTQVNAPNTGRGLANWFEQLPTAASTPKLTDAETALDKDLRNPYTERWSFGFQRQLPQNMLFDVAYVRSESHRLTTLADWNPRLPSGLLRLYPNYGPVIVKTSQGNSSYHSLQAHLDRRFMHGFQLGGVLYVVKIY